MDQEGTNFVVQKVQKVLRCIKNVGLDLPTFLYMMSYGHSACTSDRVIQAARSQLLQSKFLPKILQNWYEPPNRGRYGIIGARPTLRAFAFKCISSIMDAEMRKIQSFMNSDGGVLSEERLLELSFEELQAKCITDTPYLMKVLVHLATTKEQRQRNSLKTPQNVILLVICMLTYQRSQKSNRYQQWLSLYWVASGVPSKAFDLLHVLGLAMGATWVQDSLAILSDGALQKARAWVNDKPFALMHDNVNIAYKVSSQRIDNKNHFDSGTAITILPLPIELNTIWGDQTHRESLDNWHLASEKPCLSWGDIETAAKKTHHSVRDWFIYHIIQFLVSYPGLSALREQVHDWSLLGRPTAVHQLPFGPDRRTVHFPLKTVHIDEATHEGTANVMNEIFNQLDLLSEEQKSRIGTSSCIPWIGDQKTIMLLRHLRGMRALDRNGFVRMDWSLLFKGWFHELMALQNQIYWTHKGTPATSGLARDIKLLTRIGLSPKNRQQKADFHDLHELILHTLEAHIMACWIGISSMDSIESLMTLALDWSPTDIIDRAGKIYDTYLSGEILRPEERDEELLRKTLGRSSKKKNSADSRVSHINDDEVFINSSLFMRDSLVYFELSAAIKEGDVGRMGNLIPTLLFMFAGGGNPHYTIELLEELNLELHSFSAEELKISREYCWLANTKGKKNTFFPLDQLQEHNIRMIKYIYNLRGPNSSWDFLGKISPLIPLFQKMHFSVEKAFGTGRRGRRHGAVKTGKDVEVLIQTYVGDNIHLRQSKRHDQNGLNTNVIDNGITALRTKDTINQWLQGRDKYVHATTNDWGNIHTDVAQTLPIPAYEPDNTTGMEAEQGLEWIDQDTELDNDVDADGEFDDGTWENLWGDDFFNYEPSDA